MSLSTWIYIGVGFVIYGYMTSRDEYDPVGCIIVVLFWPVYVLTGTGRFLKYHFSKKEPKDE